MSAAPTSTQLSVPGSSSQSNKKRKSNDQGVLCAALGLK